MSNIAFGGVGSHTAWSVSWTWNNYTFVESQVSATANRESYAFADGRDRTFINNFRLASRLSSRIPSCAITEPSFSSPNSTSGMTMIIWDLKLHLVSQYLIYHNNISRSGLEIVTRPRLPSSCNMVYKMVFYIDGGCHGYGLSYRSGVRRLLLDILLRGRNSRK